MIDLSADLEEPDLSHSTPILSPFEENGIPSGEPTSDDSDSDQSLEEPEDSPGKPEDSPEKPEDNHGRDAERWPGVQSGDAVLSLIQWFYLWVVDPEVMTLKGTFTGSACSKNRITVNMLLCMSSIRATGAPPSVHRIQNKYTDRICSVEDEK